MGVFDFVKNAGAKIGIGTSTTEDAAAEAADVAAKAEADAKRANARRAAKLEARHAQRTAEADADEATAKAEKKEKATKLRQAARERMAEYNKSAELDDYLSGLGIDATGVDIRFDDGTAYITGEAVDQATKERIILAVGNAQGVGRVDEEIGVTEEAEEAHFHTVASGDTLWAVAEKVYGDGSRYTEIFEANKPMLTNPDLIFPGQVLRCPMDD